MGQTPFSRIASTFEQFISIQITHGLTPAASAKVGSRHSSEVSGGVPLPSASTREHTDGLRRSSRANTPDIGVTAPDPAEVNSPGPADHAGGELPAVRRKLSTSSGSSVSSACIFQGPFSARRIRSLPFLIPWVRWLWSQSS